MSQDGWNRHDPYSEGTPYAWSNPYAVPESEIVMSESGMPEPGRTAGVWIEKNCLVVPRGWESPAVCLLTGVATGLRPQQRKWLFWANPAWYLLIFVLGFLALFLIGILQRKGGIYYYVSHSAAAKIQKRRMINLGLFLIGLLMVILSFSPFGGDSGPLLVFPGLLLLLTSGVLATTWCRAFYARKISRTHIWIAKIPSPVRKIIVEMERTANFRPWM